MADSTFWWIAAGILVAAELLTGTFYLLMVAIGLGAAALAASIGTSFTVQLLAASLLGGMGVGVLYLKKGKNAPANANKDLHLDIGETVHVTQWQADRTTRVKYRGAEWQAQLATDATPASGAHRITELSGNCLILQPLA